MTETNNAIAYAAHLWIMFVTDIDWFVVRVYTLPAWTLNWFIIEYTMTHFFQD